MKSLIESEWTTLPGLLMSEHDERVKELQHFIEILEKSSNPQEFQMNCLFDSLGHWATKKFFERSVFEFMFGKDNNWHKELLDCKITLMKNLKKLTEFYAELIDSID